MSTNAARGLVAVGSRTATPLHVVADALAAAGVVLPAGSALAGAAVADATVPAVPGACRIGSRWNAERFVERSESVSVETVITRITGDRVERHVALRDVNGALRESGTETWLLDDPAAVEPAPELDFCSVEWGNLLSDSLEDDRGFTSSLSTWDGTIGLRCGDRAAVRRGLDETRSERGDRNQPIRCAGDRQVAAGRSRYVTATRADRGRPGRDPAASWCPADQLGGLAAARRRRSAERVETSRRPREAWRPRG